MDVEILRKVALFEGLTNAQLRKLGGALKLVEFKGRAAPVACVFAPNFSTAMNILFKLVEEAACLLGEDYDVEVVDPDELQERLLL